MGHLGWCGHGRAAEIFGGIETLVPYTKGGKVEPALTYEAALKAVVGALAAVSGQDLGAVNETTRLWSLDETDRDSLELDSLDLLEAMLDLEDSFGVSFIEDIDPQTLITIGDFASLLSRARVNDAADEPSERSLI